MPLRGLKRLELRLFGSDVDPAASVFEPRLAKELDRMGAQVDKPGREAALLLAGPYPPLPSSLAVRARRSRIAAVSRSRSPPGSLATRAACSTRPRTRKPGWVQAERRATPT